MESIIGSAASNTGLIGLATSIATNATNAIGQVLPVIAPVFAAIVVIGIVYKVIKKFSS